SAPRAAPARRRGRPLGRGLPAAPPRPSRRDERLGHAAARTPQPARLPDREGIAEPLRASARGRRCLRDHGPMRPARRRRAAARAEEARRQAAVDAADAVERAGEVKRLMARGAEAEGAAERERERVTASERERQQLAALLEDAAARERRVQEELRAASERLS